MAEDSTTTKPPEKTRGKYCRTYIPTRNVCLRCRTAVCGKEFVCIKCQKAIRNRKKTIEMLDIEYNRALRKHKQLETNHADISEEDETF